MIRQMNFFNAFDKKTGNGECEGSKRNVDFVVMGTTPAHSRGAIIATGNSCTKGAAYGPYGPAQSVRRAGRARTGSGCRSASDPADVSPRKKVGLSEDVMASRGHQTKDVS